VLLLIESNNRAGGIRIRASVAVVAANVAAAAAAAAGMHTASAAEI
jgi:hypothetical protein